MKLAGVVVGDYDGMSLPPRGAWIEMLFLAGCTPTKSWSLPPRGAWIEINDPEPVSAWLFKSLPPRGAWIEMRPFSLP